MLRILYNKIVKFGKSRKKKGEIFMAKKRILIVDDDGYNKKCEKMINIIEQSDVKYDIALTLEEAISKMFLSKEVQYDAVILDRKFPEREGKKATGKEGDLLLSMMEKNNKNIPVLIHSVGTSMPESQLVANRMNPWEIEKLQHFLVYLVK